MLFKTCFASKAIDSKSNDQCAVQHLKIPCHPSNSTKKLKLDKLKMRETVRSSIIFTHKERSRSLIMLYFLTETDAEDLWSVADKHFSPDMMALLQKYFWQHLNHHK